jgi:hypothetical protein
MGGGLLQLVAYGAQDVYLTGNPQITFFKVVYRRHTNFALESIQQTFNGNAGFGNTVYCQISRNGDLIHRTYLEVYVPSLDGYVYGNTTTERYVDYLGLRLLKSVTIEIGGQQIDKHYSDWLYIWNELSLPYGKKEGWNYMVGADSDILSSGDTTTQVNSNSATLPEYAGNTLYIPLEFWFCRNIGLALPLIALQYHEVKVKIEFESRDNCVYKTATNGVAPTITIANATNIANLATLKANLWVDYIFLDTDERRRFAQLSHEYLIEQLQFTGQEVLTPGTNRIKLNFNHPTKELIWVAKTNSTSTVNQWYNYTTNSGSLNGGDAVAITGSVSSPSRPSLGINSSNFNTSNFGFPDLYANLNNADSSNLIYDITPSGMTTFNPFNSCLLQLNGNDRFAERPGGYFNYVQAYQHHTNIPTNKGINVYSFALKPEDHQPSGTLNMSRIDTAVLSLTNNYKTSVTNAYVNIYAVNYNVLRILSGMGGLAYSN